MGRSKKEMLAEEGGQKNVEHCSAKKRAVITTR